MDKKGIPIGFSDFKTIIEEDYYFVDKSLLIDELLNNKTKVTLLPRPRRFGKTLNMSMLKYFFDIEKSEENRKLFDGLKIEQTKNIKHQGQSPVIFISFKDIKSDNYEGMLDEIRYMLEMSFNEYNIEFNSSEISLKKSILNITEIMYKRFNKQMGVALKIIRRHPFLRMKI